MAENLEYLLREAVRTADDAERAKAALNAYLDTIEPERKRDVAWKLFEWVRANTSIGDI